MIKKEVYKALKGKFGKSASWAIWSKPFTETTENMGDMKVLKNKNLTKNLNTNYIFVGLTPTSTDVRTDGYTGDWANFHSDEVEKQKDFKIRYAFNGTPYWGSYMTNILKNCPDMDSKTAKELIKEQPEVLEQALQELDEELAIIGGNPTLVAFGGDVNTILKKRYKGHNIASIYHFTHNIGPVKYREDSLKKLAAAKAK